jgi:lysophospholipase L1-like esterase
MPRPSPEELRRRRLIAVLAVFGVLAVVVIGGALAFGGSGDSESSAGPTSSTTPPTTLPPTTLVPLKVTAIGDSVMLGAADALRVTLGIDRTTVDAAESRQFSAGVDTIQEYKDKGELGDEVVVQLGTNGTINPDDFERMMGILKGIKRVVIINSKVPRPWEDEVNQVLGDGVKRYKNSVLVDWHNAAEDHPEWFYDDGLHLRPDGATAYAQLIAAKVL